MNRMRANVFEGVNRFGIQEIQRPCVGVGQAVIRVTSRVAKGDSCFVGRVKRSTQFISRRSIDSTSVWPRKP